MKKLILCGLVVGFFVGCGGTKEPSVAQSTPVEQTKIEPNFSSNTQGCTTGCMDVVIRAKEAEAGKDVKR